MAKQVNTLRLVVAVTVFDDDPIVEGDLADPMFARVIEALLPHPDSTLATSKSGEFITAIRYDVEVTS